MTQQMIDRVIAEKHIGYNFDYSLSYFVGIVKLVDGNLLTAYSTHDVVNGTVSWGVDCPKIVRGKHDTHSKIEPSC